MHRIILLYLLLWSYGSFCNAQDKPNTQLQAVWITRLAEKFHFSPQPVDDSLSAYLYRETLQQLHEDQVYFLQDELDRLSALQFYIDDDIKGTEWRFVPELNQTFRSALLRRKNAITKIAGKDVTFTQGEFYTPSRYRPLTAYPSETELENAIALWFRFKVMVELAEYGIAEDITDPKKLMKSEPDIRKKIADAELKNIEFLLDNDESKAVASVFLNALCNYYDPHSSYFSKNEKSLFDRELSSEDFRFGISFNIDESDHVIIDQLEPGGSAWKSNKLNKGDRILKLQWEGEEAVDVSEMSLTEIHDLLQRDDKQILTLTVKKLNGSKKTVRLKKQKVELKDELVKSYILSGDIKAGYIALPDFYTGWSGSSSNGCANDVAKEILKLQKENITGIILDLRNNGGGSLTEALALAGIFVNEGPLAIIHLKGEKPVTMKDENRGVIFNGPLIILVNGQSASASEVLAASLQDHNRALIVGQQTYGKATGQIIIPVDTSLTWHKIAMQDFGNPSSWMKITTSKLYRINGKTAQKKGVVPDIMLPDIYQGLYSREKDYLRVLPSDSIIKKTYFTPLTEMPEEKINTAVQERISNDSLLIEKMLFRDTIVNYIKESSNGIELNLERYMTRLRNVDRCSEQLSIPVSAAQQIYTVSNHAFEEQILSLDSYYRDLNAELLKEISGDLELMECFRILSDLINFTKK